jgi:hypothetical protein
MQLFRVLHKIAAPPSIKNAFAIGLHTTARALRRLDILCSCRSLGRKLIFITAKLQKIIRINKVEWLCSSAQLAQSIYVKAVI